MLKLSLLMYMCRYQNGLQFQFWSDSSSISIFCEYKQCRLWQDCTGVPSSLTSDNKYQNRMCWLISSADIFFLYSGVQDINIFHSEFQLTGTLANSEDPDEMPHKAAFHLGLHCLLR